MIISANFKTFKTRLETGEYLTQLEESLENSSQEVLIFPPLTALQTHNGRVKVGTQNSYPIDSGAFTGEIGVEQLDEFNIKTILIGHSERREIIGESQKEVAEKFRFFAEKGFKIIYCIGEPLSIRESGKEALHNYLQSQFDDIDIDYENFAIAYEPIWAIGTGVTPTLEEIEDTLKWIKEFSNRSLLYGGSVKLNNTEEILELPSCDGILVGSASLKVNDFIQMIKIADSLEKR